MAHQAQPLKQFVKGIAVINFSRILWFFNGVNVTGLPAGIDANPSTLRTSVRELTITQPPGILTTTGSETYRIRINGNTYTYAAPALTAGVNSTTFGTNLAAFLDGVGGVTFGYL